MYRWIGLILILTATSCSPDYPMDRTGAWDLDKVGDSNAANLRAMIVNPHDLLSGAGETTTLGAEAGPPVQNLLSGHRAELLSSDTLNLNVIAPPAPASLGGNNAGQ
jgi:hypothetical protein